MYMSCENCRFCAADDSKYIVSCDQALIFSAYHIYLLLYISPVRYMPIYSTIHKSDTITSKMTGPCPFILVGRFNFDTQLLRSPQCPMRVAHEFASKENHISLPFLQNGLCLMGFGNEANCANRKVGICFLELFGEWDLG